MCYRVAPMRHGALVSLVLLLAAPPLHAQQLAARHYDISDGLGNNLVNAIAQDARGYIWISTYDGLSRFDGYRFKTFTVRDGLPHAIAHGITEDGDGRLWTAFFRGGLVRVGDGEDGERFHRLKLDRPGWSVTSLGTTASGMVVAAADDGVYLLHAATGALERIHAAPNDTLSINAVHRDRRGRLWVGLGRELLTLDGETRRVWTAADGVGAAPITGVTEDAAGRIVVSNTRQLLELVDDSRWRVLLDAPPGVELLGVHIDRSQQMWIGTGSGLFRRDARGDLTRVPIAGLDGRAKVQHEDRDGNLWIGTDRAGVFVIGAARFANLTTAEGLPSPSVRRVVEGPNGRIFLTTDGGLREVVDGRPVAVGGATVLPSPVSRLLRDSRGDWWTGIANAVRRTPGPEPRLDTGDVVLDGLTGPEGAWFGAALAEDATGRIWTTGPSDHVYSVTRAADGTFRVQRHRFADQPLSAGTIAIDRPANVWLGSYGTLSRLRPDGRYGQVVTHADTGETLVRSLFVDSRGWLWVGQRYRGVSMTRTPDAERPDFEHYSTANGLTSDTVWTICEDRQGRMYFGTGRGLERLDPRTGAIRHYSPRDGLVGATVNHCYQDSRGRLWVATHQGVSTFDPDAVSGAAPPPVYFTRLRINDEEAQLGERGQSLVAGHVLPASSSGIVAEFVAPSAGRALRYEYFLEGADNHWSQPSDERSINLARLASGRYRLLVRAVDEEGRVSAVPAALTFEVLRPIWLRWWFLVLAASAVAAAGFALHRMRVGQILALEAVRQQVAMDLHDDIGAGLTQIAIVSELGRRDGGAPGALAETAALARTLRESMSDIVWAIDPRKDRLTELVHRFRQVAYKLLERNGVRVDFTTPPEPQMLDVELAPDRRKHLLLIFKEAASNIARHARASHVRIDLTCAAGELRLTIADDGGGFDVQTVEAGHGIGSLQARTAAMGGRLSLLSTRGAGTTVDVSVRL